METLILLSLNITFRAMGGN